MRIFFLFFFYLFLNTGSTFSDTKNDKYELYIMSQCPYGLPAVSNMRKFFENYLTKKSNFEIMFIGDVDTLGELISLRGKDEVADELLWLWIFKKYPDYRDSFLYLCADEKLSAIEAISQLGVDTSGVGEWIEKNGKSILTKQYKNSNDLNIEASPTLLINGNEYNSEISPLALRYGKCRYLQDRSSADTLLISSLNCDSLPECILDVECLKSGYLGTCRRDNNGWGECKYEKDSSFVFTVLTSNNIRFKTETDFIKTTKTLFPAAQISVVADTSKVGSELMKKYNPIVLPYFLFSNGVKLAKNYHEIEEGLINVDGSLTFNNDFVKGTYFVKDKRALNEVVIYLNSNFYKLNKSEVQNMVSIISNFNKDGKTKICFTDIDILNYSDNLTAWLTGAKLYPVENFNVVKKDVNRLSVENEPIAILIENRELVIPQGFDEVEYLFGDSHLAQ